MFSVSILGGLDFVLGMQLELVAVCVNLKKEGFGWLYGGGLYYGGFLYFLVKGGSTRFTRQKSKR